MKHQHPTIPVTSSGTAETLSTELTKETPTHSQTQTSATQTSLRVIDDTVETVNGFLSKIAVAKREGIPYVETSIDVVNHYNRNGLGDSKYFYFDGIRVYPHGTKEIVESEERMSTNDRTFGRG